jgi:hypothetical protein
LSTPSFAVILPTNDGVDATLRSLRAVAVGHLVLAGSSPAQVLADAGDGLKAVWVHADLLAATFAILQERGMRAPIIVFTPQTHEGTLELAQRAPAITGLLAWGDHGARNWEVIYLARRLLAPQEEPPHMAQLMPWGATTVAWQPKNTEQLRQIVHRIEGMCQRLGVESRVATTVSSAAHELLMNAMYDAPVGPDGRAKYAHDRTATIELAPNEVPSLRFTVDGEWIGLDAVDPFGRLPRRRFFEGVLRGHRAMMGAEGPAIDTSHGGAGLGLHTLYASGAVLRAELTPMTQTHVSWVFDRSSSRKDRSRTPRSLYFIANVTRPG